MLKIAILWVYYIIPCGFNVFGIILASHFNLPKYFVWLRVTEKDLITEPHVLSKLLIKSDFKIRLQYPCIVEEVPFVFNEDCEYGLHYFFQILKGCAIVINKITMLCTLLLDVYLLLEVTADDVSVLSSLGHHRIRYGFLLEMHFYLQCKVSGQQIQPDSRYVWLTC